MAKDVQKIKCFMGSPCGMAIVIVALFYVLTFLIYYFYSPGPEERKEAEMANSQAVQHSLPAAS